MAEVADIDYFKLQIFDITLLRKEAGRFAQR